MVNTVGIFNKAIVFAMIFLDIGMPFTFVFLQNLTILEFKKAIFFLKKLEFCERKVFWV